MKDTVATGKTRKKSYKKCIIDRWYIFPVVFFVLAVIVFYAVIGENSYIAVADNMDLFVPQYRMLGMRNIYFAHDAAAPFLDGTSRDVLPSEFNVVSFLNMVLPPFSAYVAVYVCKVLLAVVSFYLLGKEFLEYRHVFSKQSTNRIEISGTERDYRLPAGGYTRSKKAMVTLTGLAYGMLMLFPNFGIAFSAIPLVLYLFVKLDRIVSGKKIAKRIMAQQTKVAMKDSAANANMQAGKARKTTRYRRRVAVVYIAIFLYPLLSYFSYFGFFILAYATLAFIILSIRRKNLQGHIFWGICLLSAGYVLFEYRLFGMMLFGTEETIRSSIQMASVDVKGILTTALATLTTPSMHEADAHQYFVMPVCIMYFLYTNIRHIDTGRLKDIIHDKFNMCAVLLLFNGLIAGLSAYAPFRNLIATLLPPLKGFQFDRTTFFNPFLWYAMLTIICVRMMTVRQIVTKNGRVKRAAIAVANKATGALEPLDLTDEGDRLEFLDLSDHCANRLVKTGIAYALLAVSMFVILLTPTMYNDLRATLAGEVYLRREGKRSDALNWKEFYSEELFTQIKKDIGYHDEWCVAYGMYPAVLEYNGICTLDGYLGFYSQAYKEEFRTIIAPALERVEQNRLYYDNWGARCYLAFGTDPFVAMGTKSLYGLTDTDIYIDTQALKDLYGKYLFSRVKLSNAEETGLTLLKAYEEETQAYPVYVYTVN